MNYQELTEWYAGIIHKKVHMVEGDWFTCKFAPCVLLAMAIRKQRIPGQRLDKDGAGTY